MESIQPKKILQGSILCASQNLVFGPCNCHGFEDYSKELDLAIVYMLSKEQSHPIYKKAVSYLVFISFYAANTWLARCFFSGLSFQLFRSLGFPLLHLARRQLNIFWLSSNSRAFKIILELLDLDCFFQWIYIAKKLKSKFVPMFFLKLIRTRGLQPVFSVICWGPQIHIPSNLWTGQELMLKAVRDTGSALQYASQRLQNDPEAWETQRCRRENERENDVVW